MAKDNSKSQTLTLTLFPLETCPQVSDEDFNIFHTIDRELYARLVQNLGRDSAESVQVMGFWMWLERETNDMKLINRMLSLPPLLLNHLANETRLCLMCLESDKLQLGGEITLLPEILKCPVVSLGFFHENRIRIIRSVAKIINTVCVRAFREIRRGIEVGESSREAERRAAVMPMVAPVVAPLHPVVIQMPQSSLEVGRLPIHLGAQHHGMVNREENVVSRNISTVTADDRTIFLTFSKGYPIAEDEVKEYFTRRFGDFIESLIFQEVGDEEQVLYARMVVKPAAVAVMEEIAPGRGKAKYTINGKHVWARKYVKKSRSPPRGVHSVAANSSSQTALL